MKLRYDKMNGEVSRVITFENEEVEESLEDRGWVIMGEGKCK